MRIVFSISASMLNPGQFDLNTCENICTRMLHTNDFAMVFPREHVKTVLKVLQSIASTDVYVSVDMSGSRLHISSHSDVDTRVVEAVIQGDAIGCVASFESEVVIRYNPEPPSEDGSSMHDASEVSGPRTLRLDASYLTSSHTDFTEGYGLPDKNALLDTVVLFRVPPVAIPLNPCITVPAEALLSALRVCVPPPPWLALGYFVEDRVPRLVLRAEDPEGLSKEVCIAAVEREGTLVHASDAEEEGDENTPLSCQLAMSAAELAQLLDSRESDRSQLEQSLLALGPRRLGVKQTDNALPFTFAPDAARLQCGEAPEAGLRLWLPYVQHNKRDTAVLTRSLTLGLPQLREPPRVSRAYALYGLPVAVDPGPLQALAAVALQLQEQMPPVGGVGALPLDALDDKDVIMPEDMLQAMRRRNTGAPSARAAALAQAVVRLSLVPSPRPEQCWAFDTLAGTVGGPDDRVHMRVRMACRTDAPRAMAELVQVCALVKAQSAQIEAHRALVASGDAEDDPEVAALERVFLQAYAPDTLPAGGAHTLPLTAMLPTQPGTRAWQEYVRALLGTVPTFGVLGWLNGPAVEAAARVEADQHRETQRQHQRRVQALRLARTKEREEASLALQQLRAVYATDRAAGRAPVPPRALADAPTVPAPATPVATTTPVSETAPAATSTAAPTAMPVALAAPVVKAEPLSHPETVPPQSRSPASRHASPPCTATVPVQSSTLMSPGPSVPQGSPPWVSTRAPARPEALPAPTAVQVKVEAHVPANVSTHPHTQTLVNTQPQRQQPMVPSRSRHSPAHPASPTRAQVQQRSPARPPSPTPTPAAPTPTPTPTLAAPDVDIRMHDLQGPTIAASRGDNVLGLSQGYDHYQSSSPSQMSEGDGDGAFGMGLDLGLGMSFSDTAAQVLPPVVPPSLAEDEEEEEEDEAHWGGGVREVAVAVREYTSQGPYTQSYTQRRTQR